MINDALRLNIRLEEGNVLRSMTKITQETRDIDPAGWGAHIPVGFDGGL